MILREGRKVKIQLVLPRRLLCAIAGEVRGSPGGEHTQDATAVLKYSGRCHEPRMNLTFMYALSLAPSLRCSVL